MVPVDDSLIFGPFDGLYDIDKTLEKISIGKPNAILGFRSDLEKIFQQNSSLPFILNATASTTKGIHTRKMITSSIDSAISMAADCIAIHLNVSSKYENEMLANFAKLVEDCDKYGIPVLAIVYPRKELDGKDYNYEDLKLNNVDEFTEIVCHCVRIADELGADIIKTYYTGSEESFKKVVACTAKPIIIAGGPVVSVEESFSNAIGCIKAGGKGISFGRNVFNSQHIIPYLTIMNKIVFENYNLDQAMNEYYELIENRRKNK